MTPLDTDTLLERAAALPGLGALLGAIGEGFQPRLLLVGGAVRDLLLERDDPADLDLIVEGDVEPALAAVEAAGGSVTRAHDRFDTATVTVAGITIDLARSRTETYAFPGALPAIARAPASEDLARRDFTVNAVALVLTGIGRGSLLAVPTALDDLSDGVLRVLHDASFLDDPTRLLRLARYAGRLGFTVGPETEELAVAAVAGGALGTISGTRLGNELRLLAREPEPLAGFAWLRRLGVDAAIAPGFGVDDPSLVARALRLLPDDGRRELVVLGVAVLGVPAAAELGVPAAADGSSAGAAGLIEELVSSLGFVAAERDALVTIALRADKLSARLEMAGPPSEIDEAVRWFVGSGTHAVGVAELVAIAGAIHPASAAREWLVELRGRSLAIDGADVIAAGIAPGPLVGQALGAARAAMLDGEAVSAEAQLAVALAAVQPG